MAGTKRNHLQDAQIAVHRGCCREGVSPIVDWASRKRIDVLPVAVQANKRVIAKTARHAQNGRELKARQETHQFTWVGVRRRILGIVEIRSNEPESTQGQPVPLILQRWSVLPVQVVR